MTRLLKLFSAAGYDVTTVENEHLSGCSDRKLYEVCVHESRCLATLDMDFSDVTRFAPGKAGGIIVLRLPRNPTLPAIEGLALGFLRQLAREPLAGRLWIVEPGRIRIHQDDGEPEDL